MEVNTLFVLGGLTLTIMILSGPLVSGLAVSLKPFLSKPHQIPADGNGLMVVARNVGLITLGALALPMLMAIIVAIAGGVVQHKPLWTPTPLKPQFSRVSPLAGMKRMFGMEAGVQFIKGLLKLGIIGALAAYLMWSERDRLESMVRLDLAALLPAVKILVLKLMIGVLSLFAIVAAGDFIYAKMSWRKRHRMTQHELKEEFKNSDGNPEVKNKLKQIRMQRFKKRMMQEVSKSTVIITNPTHYAVALRYEPGMPAPICVAKGVDSLALRIRKIAGEHEVPIIENPPLARALHATAEIDAEIPVEHYKAVAEVIGYVLRLRRRPG
jgi:flagellar biosynthesis protein FlhB